MSQKEKLSEKVAEYFAIYVEKSDGTIEQSPMSQDFKENIYNPIVALEAENQRLKEKADKWDTFYGSELHPNPVVQAECDRIENEELKSRLSKTEKLLEKWKLEGFPIHTWIKELESTLKGG